MSLSIAIWSHTINLKQHWYVTDPLFSVFRLHPLLRRRCSLGLAWADVVERAGIHYADYPLNPDAQFNYLVSQDLITRWIMDTPLSSNPNSA